MLVDLDLLVTVREIFDIIDDIPDNLDGVHGGYIRGTLKESIGKLVEEN